jgi:hypothetical protein
MWLEICNTQEDCPQIQQVQRECCYNLWTETSEFCRESYVLYSSGGRVGGKV